MSLTLTEGLTGSRVKARLLHWLYVEAAPGVSYPERALARQAGVPAGSVHKALMRLVSDQLVVRVETPRGPEYRAPFEDPRLTGLFNFLRQDSEIVAALTRALKRFRSIEYACIFGSFARGNTHRGSDIDVLILECSDDQRFDIMGALAKVGAKIKREVNGQFYSTGEFKRLLAEGDSIAVSMSGDYRIDLKGTPPWPQ